MNYYDIGQAIGYGLFSDPTFETIDFGVKKKKKCDKGYGCGGACISTKKNCKVALKGEAKNFAEYVRQNKKRLTKAQKSAARRQNIGLKTNLKMKRAKRNILPEKKRNLSFNEVIEKGKNLINSKDRETLDKYVKSVQSIEQRRKKLQKKYKEMKKDNPYLKIPSEMMREFRKLDQESQSLFEKPELLKAIKVLDEVKQKLTEKHGVSTADADKIIAKINITNNASSIYPDVKKDLREIIQLTGSSLKRLKKIDLVENRAYANNDDGLLNIGIKRTKEAIKSDIFHEVGHFLEFEDETTYNIANKWREDKAIKHSNEAKPKIQSLRQVSTDYDDDEIAFVDKYFHPYVGKIYSDKATEVVSMGLQMLKTPKEMLELYEKDSSHFYLILGLMLP